MQCAPDAPLAQADAVKPRNAGIRRNHECSCFASLQRWSNIAAAAPCNQDIAIDSACQYEVHIVIGIYFVIQTGPIFTALIPLISNSVEILAMFSWRCSKFENRIAGRCFT
jgi:hypothetical protein